MARDQREVSAGVRAHEQDFGARKWSLSGCFFSRRRVCIPPKKRSLCSLHGGGGLCKGCLPKEVRKGDCKVAAHQASQPGALPSPTHKYLSLTLASRRSAPRAGNHMRTTAKGCPLGKRAAPQPAAARTVAARPALGRRSLHWLTPHSSSSAAGPDGAAAPPAAGHAACAAGRQPVHEHDLAARRFRRSVPRHKQPPCSLTTPLARHRA